MKILRYILFPIVPIYYLVTRLRNRLYDLGIKKSTSYNLPIICVGNLSVGGTGKTPMIEYLIRLLKDDYKVATLSRGYKRKTNGFQLANKNSTSVSIGDEPFQFYTKFKKDIDVAVDTNRNNGIQKLLAIANPPEVVLLDDAFQHRKVKAGFNIMLTTYQNPYFNDIVLPTGNLREPRIGMNRADAIVVTKCPDNLASTDKETILKRINRQENQQVFFSSIAYSDFVFSSEGKKNLTKLNEFTLVTGIANANSLVDFLKERKLKFEHLNFKDHHEFTAQDIKDIEKKELILTTEKDFMRLKQYNLLKHKLFYLPIQINIDNEANFCSLIESFVKSYN
ncbi:tetraacyldisaccharide 4'-kinase [uncultured Algibacter sp.]|uniref:tetraacyldisaccharide 4'-kinase n=1 Tax=uncultured Algibacter sp. TaxID=298659 RepID=UPI002629DE0F|nr:tetraacyldisaccharide 4'-kinase [uncultured Algibacter sp.]